FSNRQSAIKPLFSITFPLSWRISFVFKYIPASARVFHSRPLFSITFPHRSVKKRILPHGSMVPVQLKKRTLPLFSYLLDYSRELICAVASKRASANAQASPGADTY